MTPKRESPLPFDPLGRRRQFGRRRAWTTNAFEVMFVLFFLRFCNQVFAGEVVGGAGVTPMRVCSGSH